MHKNRKKHRVTALTIVGVLFVVCLAFILHKRKEGPRSAVLTGENLEIGVGEFNWGELPTLPQKAMPSLTPSPAPSSPTETAATLLAQSPIAKPSLTVDPSVLYLRKVPFLSGKLEIAMVDADRLLALHPPASDSSEARAHAIPDIQRATALCARAHDCEIVLDISGHSANGIPVVLCAVETIDLTDEVMLRLGR